MYAYLIRRLIEMVPTLLLVTLATFCMTLLLPGDPVTAMVATGVQVDQAVVNRFKHDLGLDQPIPIQYINWVGKALRGDLGTSMATRQPVTREFLNRAPATLQLGVLGFILSVVISIPAGIVSAVKRNSWLDSLTTVLSMAGVAIPGFFLGILMIFVFAVALGWLPASGFVSITENPVDGLRYLAMPAFSLAVAMAATNVRQTRSAMLEVLAQDYVRTARAKGLRERSVIWLHALKNALLPVVTIMGMMIGRLIAGEVIIEQVFAIPGIGRWAVQAIFLKDFTVVQAFVLVAAVATLLANLATDLLYGLLDPRIRYT